MVAKDWLPEAVRAVSVERVLGAGAGETPRRPHHPRCLVPRCDGMKETTIKQSSSTFTQSEPPSSLRYSSARKEANIPRPGPRSPYKISSELLSRC